MRNHTSIKVNNEYKTSFWEDDWLGRGCPIDLPLTGYATSDDSSRCMVLAEVEHTTQKEFK